MNKFYKILLVFSIVCSTYSCKDFPSDFVAPEFNANATIPLVDTLETIDKAIGDDTTYVKKSSDGNIYINHSATIYDTKFGDAIKMTSMSFKYLGDINSQKEFLNNVNSIGSASLLLTRIFPTLPAPPNKKAIPATPVAGITLSTNTYLPANIEYINFDDGTLHLELKNNTPISFEIMPQAKYGNKRGLIYYPSAGVEYFIELSDQQAFFPPFSKRGGASDTGGAITFSLKNVNVNNSGSFNATLKSAGSSVPVSYDNNTGIDINIFCSDPVISSTKIAYESKKYTFYIEMPFKDNVILTDGQISNFLINGVISNGTPISGNAEIVFTQLKYVSNNQLFSRPLSVMANNQFQQITPISNGGEILKLEPDSTDMVLNQGTIKSIRAKLIITADAIPNSDKKVFNASDQFKIDGNIDNAQFIYAKGLSAPTIEVKVVSGVKVNSKDYSDKFSFVNFNAGLINARLFLKNSADIEGELSGNAYIIAKGGRIMDSINIPIQYIAGKSETEIQVSKKNVSINEVPDSVNVVATIKTLPSRPFNVYSSDVVNGRIEFNFPLKLKLETGLLKDTVSMNIDKDIKDNKNYFVSGDLRIEILNRIPTNSTFKITFTDSAYNKILDLPKSSPFSIKPPTIDDNGYAVNFTKSFNSIALDSIDINKIIDSKYMLLVFELSSADANKECAFRLQDYIHVKAELKLKAKSEKE